MCQFLYTLGLRADPTSTAQIPNYAAALIITNYILTNIVFSPTLAKRSAGLHDPVSPREGLETRGEAAVKEGKITRRKLNMIKRQAAAQSNGLENFPFFLGTVLLGLHAGLPNATINGFGVAYTIFRTVYYVAYSFTERKGLVAFRGISWTGGVLSCWAIIFWSGKALNAA